METSKKSEAELVEEIQLSPILSIMKSPPTMELMADSTMSLSQEYGNIFVMDCLLEK